MASKRSAVRHISGGIRVLFGVALLTMAGCGLVNFAGVPSLPEFVGLTDGPSPEEPSPEEPSPEGEPGFEPEGEPDFLCGPSQGECFCEGEGCLCDEFDCFCDFSLLEDCRCFADEDDFINEIESGCLDVSDMP